MKEAKQQRSRWWRRVAWALGALAALLLLVVIGLELGLRQPGARQAVIERLELEVTRRFGLALAIEDLRISLLRGTAEIDGVSLGSPGETPLITARRIEASLRIVSLWDRPMTLRRLVITQPHVDLDAQWPELSASSDSDEVEVAVAVEHFELAEGRVDGPVLPEELEHWIEKWWLEDLHLEGHYGSGGAELQLQASPTWNRSDGRQVSLALAGQLEGEAAGPWQIQLLTVEGDGLSLEVTGALGLEADQPLQGSFELDLRPELLVPVPAATAPVRLSGEIDARQGSGRLRLAAGGLPVELAHPWLPEETRDELRLSDWRLDLDADLSQEPASGEPKGSVRLRLSRHEDTWMTGEVELLSPEAHGALALGFETVLLPDRPGRRSVRGILEAPEPGRLAESVLTDGEFQIVETEIGSLLRDVEALQPGLLGDNENPRLAGKLDVQGRVAGPLNALEGTLAASFTQDEAIQLQLEASGSAERVVVDSFSGWIEGRHFQGRGEVGLPAPITTAELQLDVEQPIPALAGVAVMVRLVDGVLEVTARPRTDDRVIGTVDAQLPLESLAQVPGVAGLPLYRADGPLRIDWQVPEAQWSGFIAELQSSQLRLGSQGSLTFDPRHPLAGSGEIVVEGLGIEHQDLSVVAEGLLRLRLDRGELVLEPVRLRTGEGLLEIEAWTDLEDGWQPGDPIETVLRRFEVEANGVAPLALLQGLAEDIYTDGDLQLALSVSGTTRELSGELRVMGPEARLAIADPEGLTLSRPELEIVFEGDRLHVAQARLGIDDAEIVTTGEVPLPTLLALFETEVSDPAEPREPMLFNWEAPAAEWAPTLGTLGVAEPPESLWAGGRGEVRLDPSRPLETVGWLEISPLEVTIEGHQVKNDGPLRIEIADGRLTSTSFRLLADGQPFALSGHVVLDRDWAPGDSKFSLVEAVALEGRGTLAAALLNPFLAGGAAEGLLELDFDLHGTLEDPEGRLRIVGPEASVLFVSPYVARIEAPELDLELVEGRVEVRDGRLRLNEGDVELGGSLGLDGIELTADFDGLRLRLDYGLFARVDGDLDLTWEPEGRARLTGEIIVDQGSLTRSINIDRDLISDLLSPIDLTGSEASPLEQIDLDLRLETRRGVRVRNNVADLAVRWNAVQVRGTLLQPVIDGQFIVEPGGRAFLFGQTLRIDQGVVTFPGQPGAEAVLDLETTSSLDDPSISRLAGEDVLALGPQESVEDFESRVEAAGWSTAAFVGEQIATRISEAVPGARITFRPILIFGEADPEARLTVGRDFSRYVTLAASIDLRNAERQTYLMEAHALPVLPGLILQVFTNDQDQEGFTLQHRLRFGSYRRKAPTGPRLHRLEIDRVAEISPKTLRRASGLTKGERASADDLFLAEVEISESLRGSGYPDARVKVVSRPVPERPERVDVEASIRPGPLVRFQFEGEPLPKSLRRSITPLYRSDFYEPVALEEMQAQTVRALRSLGFVRPEVEIEVDSDTDADGRPERLVTIRSQGGEQLPLDTLIIEGLADDEAEQVSASFATRVQLVELVAAEAAAERKLLSAVQALGYPQPEIAGRRLSKDGRVLTMEVEPGPARRLAGVTVKGVEEAEAVRLGGVAGVEAGEIARRDRIAAGALAIENDLHSRGHVKARVNARLETADSGEEAPVELVYEATPGPSYTVADTRISGLSSTSKRWATSVAEIESGAPLREDEVAAARSRLYETGLFTMVGSETLETDGGGTQITFDVEERPRFSVAYGLRWDSDEGAQGVIDAVDGNLLGRGVTLGLRALYAQDDWSVRLGAGVPRLFGTRAVLEVFGSYRDVFDELSTEFTTTQFDEQTVENSLQVAYPFGPHVFGRVYGRYRAADLLVTEIDEDPIFPLPPTSLEFHFKTPLLGTLWTYDSRDRELVLSRGLFASLDLSGTGGFLNSDFEYVRLFSQVNLYRPVGYWAGRGMSWAQSVRVGLADSFDQELDRNDRFYAGGQYSVRGYPTESLGPVEELGEETFPLGGKTLLVINEELRFDLLGPVAGLVFFDLGNVWEDTAQIDSDLFKSLGVGLRAVTPVGLLRLDWAFPLDRREGDPSSKIYFGFGNTF